ncbi:MAG: phosphoglucosamine mutase [Candidatus Micrarchaeota archaeon]|nr:phosphoglucosamine mutase [Candidatus Micrarchaeota archaeon]
MSLFGTNGVRGKIDFLTPQLAFDLAASFASWCQANRIVLARDMRMTSPMLHCAAQAGIMSAGKDVLDLGLVSSPVAEWALEKNKAGGLIIVTASHNPPEWNALKFVDERGVAISKERGAEIEKMAVGKKYRRAEWSHVGKKTELAGATLEHAKAVVSRVDAEKIKKRRLRVALDFGNGTSALSRGVFEGLGCEVLALNEKIDGTFPGRLSEPAEANVQELLKAVKLHSCDFGVAWDGDSDRVIFVDEKGSWIVGDKGFAISAKQACKEAKGQKEKFVVTTVATSRAVEDACAEFGARTIYTKVGAPYLSEKMAELGARAVSGGEEVGGIIWPRFSLAKDGIFAAAKMCEMVCERKLSELVAGLPLYYNSKAKPEVAGEGAKQKGLEAARKYAEKSGGRLTLIDGVRVDFEEGWVIVRASGTENAMRIFAEAKSQKRADELMKEYKGVVEEALKG